MRRKLSRALLVAALLLAGAGAAGAEVKRVRMRIAGYLCGN
ncbi:MAG TPA: hypothetical protein VNA19_07670 [Pyrinomonadaceae bacterium]|jgi:hypothetical protein|nr:hypothetical protein [Pyrinomonadaceae bacterium]